ncbi:MAG: dTDP-4-dehydrorhamnose 3,5-epimerase family protein [Candidatus Zixiibacteriota bacterium]|nr:MAG: dTDP-4-dehydrorhamnose 3,5-epimerase family protein [candidate division Zixibacteria bacterium]
MRQTIDGVIIRDLVSFEDQRGWLMELFRHDELDADIHPVMSYVSATRPGVARGPHEHTDQTDLFCFLGPSLFRLYLWDNRPRSATYGNHLTLEAGEGKPLMVAVPAGVVHAYKNIGTEVGIVYNAPNRLYRGEGRKSEVDEIRHEDDPGSPFKLSD